MVIYPEEIVEITTLLVKDIADSKDNIDAKLVASLADRCAELIKNLAERTQFEIKYRRNE